jgi:hypothetical protein
MSKIVVFSPSAGIAKHSYPEAWISNLVKGPGDSLTHIGCNTMLKRHCLTHSAFGLNELSSSSEREKVCAVCIRTRQDLSSAFDESRLLDEFAEQGDAERVDAVIRDFIKEGNRAQDIEWEGLPIGRIASYEFILHYKISDMDKILPEKLEIYANTYLRNALLVYLAGDRLLKSLRPDLIVMSNTGYSIHNVIRELGKRMGIRTLCLHGGPNRERAYDSMYVSWNEITGMDLDPRKYFVENQGKIGLDYRQYQNPLTHLRGVWNASTVWTYSEAKSNRLPERYQKLKYDGRKIIMASLSSLDESYAMDFAFARGMFSASEKLNCFENQIVWMQALLRHFAKRSDRILIIRLHPRDFPNRRESVLSDAARKWTELFQDLPQNVILNHPEEKISIYDLFSLIDLHLVANSSTGLESSIVGIPTLSFVGRAQCYIARQVPKTQDEYFAAMDNALPSEFQPDFSGIRRACDWLLYLNTRTVLNFDSRDFWNPRETFVNRARRKWRHLRSRSLFGSYSSYQRQTTISKEQRLLCRKIMEEGKELYQLSGEVLSRPPSTENEEHYLKYLQGVFAAYFSLDLPTQRLGPGTIQFTYTDDGTFSAIKEGDAIRAIIPRRDHAAYSLAKAIQKVEMP